MSQPLELYIIASTGDRYTVLNRELASLPYVHVAKNYADAVRSGGGFDALFESLMSAREWGSVPFDAPLYRTRIIKMPDHQVAQGRPHYGIPGIPIAPDDELTAAETTRLILCSALDAVAVFNENSPTKLKNIGAVDLSLGLDELQPDQAFDIFESVFVTSSDLTGPQIDLSGHGSTLNADFCH